MRIVGAGMAGLLAGCVLREKLTGIYEKQSELPNNHSAVLRFRTNEVAAAIGIDFKKVKVMKAIQPWRNPIADALSYSHKTNGTATLRSITGIPVGGEVVERYIAPPNLIKLMSSKIHKDSLYIGNEFRFNSFLGKDPIISTIPMPSMMDIFGWKDKPDFEYRQGINYTCELGGVDAYVSLYIPDPAIPWSRASITGNRLIVESYYTAEERPDTGKTIRHLREAMDLLGIDLRGFGNVEFHKQQYAKILPIDENVRKRFILWATEKHNIYSLGRFATWRPGLLLDDLLQDISIIRRLAEGQSTHYSHSIPGQ